MSLTALYTLSTLAIVFGFEANIQKEKGGLSPQFVRPWIPTRMV
jgi:hypothetical protein